MVIVFLSQGQRTKIDRDDMERVVNAGKWFAQKSTTTDDFYVRKSGGGPLLSRFIAGADSLIYVDHKNHDTLDNRKENLRECSPQKSVYNRLRKSENTSGMIGVGWHKLVGKWVARISVDGHRIVLGYFEDKNEAARVRDAAVKLHHGEFGVLNFP
jgi:hypothetical protein